MKSRFRTGSADSMATIKWAIFVALVLILGWIWWPAAKYPLITSPESDVLIRKLSTACGREDQAALAAIKADIVTLNLPPEEQAAFESIIQLAEGGQWKDSQRASIQFAQDQVR